MVFAQIKNMQVVNTIVVADLDDVSLFSNDPVTNVPYDYVLQVDTTYPQPGIGWAFDGIQFMAPDE